MRRGREAVQGIIVITLTLTKAQVFQLFLAMDYRTEAVDNTDAESVYEILLKLVMAGELHGADGDE